MTNRYQDVIERLRVAYDANAPIRNGWPKTQWKLDERAKFLERLRDVGAVRLLEIGAGTGDDSRYFLDNGIDVVATDLSLEMVARCRAKGIEAHVMDFSQVDFSPSSFDAVYALNCLLHVPNADLPAVLRSIHDLLVPGGLFFLGVYGGDGFEGTAPEDAYDPPRFFSFRTDGQIQGFAIEHFEIIDFHVVDPDETHFQSLTLRRPPTPRMRT